LAWTPLSQSYCAITGFAPITDGDIDLDDGSSNYLIEDQSHVGGGLKLREGFGRIARNNILVNNNYTLTFGSRTAKMYSNTTS